jgi:hypothetical protein
MYKRIEIQEQITFIIFYTSLAWNAAVASLQGLINKNYIKLSLRHISTKRECSTANKKTWITFTPPALQKRASTLSQKLEIRQISEKEHTQEHTAVLFTTLISQTCRQVQLYIHSLPIPRFGSYLHPSFSIGSRRGAKGKIQAYLREPNTFKMFLSTPSS